MKTILVVDDDEKIRLALSVRLKAAGYAVLLAKGGQEGLKLARVNWPDLVLLDIGLPLMDIWMPLGVGYSVARRLNSMGRGCMPIIFITASRESGLREAAHAVGAAGFFEKPYNAEELLGAISRILRTNDSNTDGSGAQPGITPDPPLQPQSELRLTDRMEEGEGSETVAGRTQANQPSSSRPASPSAGGGQRSTPES